MSIVNKSNTIIEGRLTVGQTSDGAFPLYVNGSAAVQDNFIVYGNLANVNVGNDANGYLKVNSDDGTKTFEILNTATKARLHHPDGIIIKSDKTSFLLDNNVDVGSFGSSGLTVKKDADIAGRIYTNSGGLANIGILGKAKADGWAARYDSNNANFSGFYFDANNDASIYLRDDAGNANVLLSSDSNSYVNKGNFGVGTVGPGAKLDVASGDIRLATNGTYLRVRDSGGAQPRVLGMNASNNFYVGPIDAYAGGPMLYGLSTDVTKHNFYIGGSEKVTIDDTGNVGIGTNDPSEELEVNGTIYSTPIAYAANQDAYALKVGAATSAAFDMGLKAKSTSGGSPYMSFSTNSADDVLTMVGAKVGVGTAAPDTKLHIKESSNSAFTGTGEHHLRLESDSTNDKYTGIGFAQASNVDIAKIAMKRTSSGSHLYFGTSDNYGNGVTNEALVIYHNGNVGIGDTTPSYELDVNGTIRATGDVIAYSDERVKENIKTIENASEKVSKLRGVEFNKIGEDSKSIGVIAQEIEKVVPEVVKTDDEGMKAVAYGNLVGLLIESNKELLKRIEKLENGLTK